ncbi:PAS domain S-box protein [Sinorhizobium alkalisoli]|uniref:PAS domain S-box protein n=1 Tax=Sinorhizobium alkalisoli TaxID=1752398 RepID=UPI00124EA274|nr:PAS domain S-box protein [Sinorhizobium alkalisoli]QFI70397.1 diguanylate cyclase/phosphodiesterase (GGDEF & EAL domain) with PAS/PAC sensor(s) [Sinorhizobium alkalisoli]
MNVLLAGQEQEGFSTALAQVLDGVPSPLVVKDSALQILFVNLGACALLGRPRDELIGCTDGDIWSKERADRLRALDQAVLATGRERSCEEQYVSADGRESVLLMTKRRLVLQEPWGYGETFLITSFSDVSELRKTQQVLRTKEEHHRAVIDLHPQIPWTADPDGNILEVGPRWAELTGIPEDETLGSGWMKALCPDDAGSVDRQWQHALSTGEPLDVEYRVEMATGDYRWFRARAAARRDTAGSIIRWYGILEDVDDRRRATDALKESEARFRAIADNAPVMIWVADGTGHTSFFSRLWLETTGQSEEEALGFGWVDVIHPDDRQAVETAFFSAGATREPVRTEYRLRRADGSWAWILDVGQPRFSSDGRFLGYVGSALDISERRAAEIAQQESEAFIKSIFDSSVDCVRVLDLDGRPLMMNRAGRELFGISEDAGIEDQTWRSIGLPEDAPKVQAGFETVRQGQSARFEIIVRDAQGRERSMDVNATPVLNAQGKPFRMLSIWRDITDAKRASADLQTARDAAEAAANRLSAVLESTMDSVILVDELWRLRYLNENAKRLLRLDDNALGLPLWRLFPRERKGVFAKNCRKVMKLRKPAAFEDYLPSLDIWIEVNASPTQDGISIFFRDITERRRTEEDRLLAHKQIAHMARHDMLTGLPNRLSFRECFDRALDPGRGKRRIAVLCLDLDGFKLVNDTLGHPAGDALLRQVSARLAQIVAESDTVARLGGDEFAIIRPLSPKADAPSILAERVIQALSEPFTIDNINVAVGASVGIATTPEDGTTADELIKAADIALYSAKAAGRGTYRQFEATMGAQLHAHQQMKLALREALGRGELELHYQPLISLHSKKVSCCEALLRWRSPERGLVAPDHFIPIAEETGLIVPIGEWTLEQACRDAAGWPADVAIAVNLSPVQFKSKRLVGAVATAIKSSGIDPARLQIEITETVLLDESEHNLELLQELRNLGVKIAMDDFGTGYSSLGYLRSFPFDKIKVDRSFIHDLPRGKESLAIVKAVAGLGHSLGITTTVEGIETEDQLNIVSSEGFDEAQGFLFALPMSASEIMELIRQSPPP